MYEILITPLSAMGLIVSLQFFFNDGFGIKLPSKVHMPLNKLNQTKY